MKNIQPLLVRYKGRRPSCTCWRHVQCSWGPAGSASPPVGPGESPGEGWVWVLTYVLVTKHVKQLSYAQNIKAIV